jgi:hypothetical protein
MLAMLPRLKTAPPHQISSYLTLTKKTDFERIRERNFWISVEGTFES